MKQEMAKLRQQLEEERTQTRAEITKRKEAEKKEQSAIKHQSAMAREKHDRDQEVAELKKALQEFRGDKITLTRRLDEVRQDISRHALTTPGSRSSYQGGASNRDAPREGGHSSSK
jgi:hypothetical protein